MEWGEEGGRGEMERGMEEKGNEGDEGKSGGEGERARKDY